MESVIPETDNDEYDVLINSEVILPHQDKNMHAVVVGRHRDGQGRTIGTKDKNHILNTAVYDVQFSDGAMKQYAANTIAENLYSQVDIDGHVYLMIDSIVDHRKTPEAVGKTNQYFVTKSGQKKLRQTTKG